MCKLPLQTFFFLLETAKPCDKKFINHGIQDRETNLEMRINESILISKLHPLKKFLTSK